MSVTNWSEYDEKMLEAFVVKPEKMLWYRDLYDRAMRFGKPKLCWKWSWWAFFGGLFFPLYRKAYLAALGVYGINVLLSILVQFFMPQWVATYNGGYISEDMKLELIRFFAFYLATVIGLAVVVGGYASYFIIKRYCDLKEAIEAKYANEEDRVAIMARHGGVHQWVVTLAIIIAAIVNVFLLFALFAAM
ncbi:MAG: DUF2628 domain-containing protein [Helicobacteraceae bacterium]|nr:DUF2628 domain-containing protein [Helicobacteraceae bacterium]